MHHPWRAFAALSHVTLLWADLGGHVLGLTDHDAQTVTLALGMTQAQRRSAIAHETVHIERGKPAPLAASKDEAAVRRETARRLLPDIRAVGEALAWAASNAEAAEELWVDEGVLADRLRWLHPAEVHYLRRRLAEV